MVSLGNKIELLEDTYKVNQIHGLGYYLNGITTYNDRIFEKLKLSRIEFAKQVLGYCIKDSATFPFCKTLEDLNKLITALRAKINPCISTTTEIW